MSEKPTVLISSANDAQSSGWTSKNGGCKLYALWVNLLRQHGYPAYIVTYDGTGVDWLIEMPLPFLSIAEASAMKASGQEIRFMTGWLWSKAYLDLVGDDGYYFFDAELAFTAGAQRNLLAVELPRMTKIATHSRTQQAWYGATFGAMPLFIPEWSADVWRPCASKRVAERIGFLNEGDHTYRVIGEVQAACARNGMFPEFCEIGGSENDVLHAMQTCDLYLGLNTGKHVLWGEGCPRGQQEAQHAGAVVVAFDVHGNAEYLFDGYNGFIVANGDAEAMGRRVIALLTNYPLREAMRLRSIDYALNYFTPEKRWNAVAEFLDLETKRT